MMFALSAARAGQAAQAVQAVQVAHAEHAAARGGARVAPGAPLAVSKPYFSRAS